MEAPLLDAILADELFATRDEEDRAMVRGLCADFEADVPARFASLRGRCAAPAESAAEARRELHALRGVVANFALARAAARLNSLERDWTSRPGAELVVELAAAESDVRAGMSELQARCLSRVS